MKKIIVALITALLMFSVSITAYANDIAVYDNNCNGVDSNFLFLTVRQMSKIRLLVRKA